MELTNREIATTAWLIALFLWALTQSGIRRSIWRVVVVASGPRLAIPALIFLLYLSAVVAIAYQLGAWDALLLKDTAVWFVVGGLPLFAKFVSIGEPKFMRGAILRAIALPELIAFTLGLVSFPIAVELVLLPVIGLVAGVSAYAASRREYGQVTSVMNWTLAIIGVAMVAVTLTQLVLEWQGLDWSHLALSFYLPLWLTAAALPFVYALGMYSRWEQRRLRMRPR